MHLQLSYGRKTYPDVSNITALSHSVHVHVGSETANTCSRETEDKVRRMILHSVLTGPILKRQADGTVSEIFESNETIGYDQISWISLYLEDLEMFDFSKTQFASQFEDLKRENHRNLTLDTMNSHIDAIRSLNGSAGVRVVAESRDGREVYRLHWWLTLKELHIIYKTLEALFSEKLPPGEHIAILNSPHDS